jgi:hypothetical protein
MITCIVLVWLAHAPITSISIGFAAKGNGVINIGLSIQLFEF